MKSYFKSKFNIKKFSKSSIRTKINLLIFTIVLVSLISITGVFSHIYSKTLIQQTTNDSLYKLQLISNNIELLTQSIENYSRIIITSQQMQDIINSHTNESDILQQLNNVNILKGTFSNLIERNNIINSIFVLNLNNNFIYDIGSNAYGIDYNSFANQSDIEHLTNQSQHFLWTDLYTSKFKVSNSHVRIMTLYEPIMNMNTGHIDGIIAININERAISSILAKTNLGTSGEFYIVRNNKTIISSEKSSSKTSNISSDTSIDFSSTLEQSDNKAYVDHKKNLIVTYNSSNDWKIIGIVPINELLPNKGFINLYVFIIGIFSFFFAILISFFFTKRITTPIIALTNIMEEISINGNIELKIDENNYTDEANILLKSYNKMMTKISELLKMVKQEQKLKREYELSMVHAQIKPHFLYNTINSICGLMCIEEYDKSFNMIKSLGQFYKLSLNNGNKLITIGDELKLIKNYINIQRYTYGSKLSLIIDVQPKIMLHLIPKLTLQPLVENSFKHGFAGLKNIEPIITIIGKLSNGCIQLSIGDNGKGCDAKKMNDYFRETDYKKIDSFGLNSIYTLLNFHFDHNFTIKCETQLNKGTIIILELPIGEEPLNDQNTIS